MLERSDQEALLGSVHAHLESEGHFVAGALFPHAALMADEPEEQAWFSYCTLWPLLEVTEPLRF